MNPRSTAVNLGLALALVLVACEPQPTDTPVTATVAKRTPTSAQPVSPPPAVEQTYSLIEHFDNAVTTAPKPTYVKKSAFKINGDQRDVVFMAPHSRATFTGIDVSKGTRLDFSMALDPAVWAKDTDGVTFNIYVDQGKGEPKQVFTKHINPAGSPADRKWVEASVSLDSYAGSRVTLILETTGGPGGNTHYDWSGWSGLNLVVPTQRM